MNLLLFVILVSLSCIIQLSFGCVIHNSNSGVCTKKYLPVSDDLQAIEEAKARWQKDLPFCGKYVSNYYPPCVPAMPTSDWTAADANFSDGRLAFSDGDEGHPEDVYSIQSKDKWVEETVANTIEARIELEQQHGSRHYFKNKDCQEAYGRYMCWLNFPRCNDFQESLGLCQSVCENLFRVCGFASDLWRCDTDVVDGEDEYNVRAFFPGQPFIRNEYHPKTKEPLAVCTPAIKGAAQSRQAMTWLSFMLLVVSVYFSYC